ncbi:alpha/beta hydrolase [Cognatiyoonia sp. IB215446]|uniref:alpha/beta fold hydrolase n=1 Tax=Cognatiyoonia sp. IB215446 TaxID=3097355 RepID=UPI002A1671A1|nr:alpha/beta hydrolase [Cognatiyoonia sp. IB215446]MDX8349980.1 alpha/beta hydrolase [Cognatiyoonia sp. IB215446]
MIPGFTQSFVQCGDVQLSVHRAGQGTPLILLHGYPENHHCWAQVTPAFTADFDVIVPDLRGYGDSDAPTDDATHVTYSKRQMAADIVALMDALGIAKAHILGHDRGGRVAYRFALDHPDRLHRLGIIEIVPTGDFWTNWNADLAMKAYHWTFLAQPAPLPERMIGADPAAYIDWTLASWTLSQSLKPFSDAALASYRAQAQDPAHLHAMCADYRAGATIDKALDEADRAAGRRINAPLHFLWAEGGFPAKTGNPAALWAPWAETMTDGSCKSGHFTMEENPKAVIDNFLPFFSAH